MLKSVSEFISRNNLLLHGRKYLVAFSGGADSTALLLILKNLGYDVEAAHCNFHLRAEESDRDERFCIDLCDRNNIVLHIAHFDTVAYAELHKVSIEMAARDLRYAYFRQLLRDIGAEAICVAHHRDDSAETLLMNIIRGTGIQGLTGIRPVNGDIIRPLLCVSRNDIEHYLDCIGQKYVTDSTNLINNVIRNKIRLDVIPLLQSVNPAAKINMARTAERMTEAIKVFESAISKSVSDVIHKDVNNALCVDLHKLRKQPSPQYTLYYILKEYAFSSAEIDNIYSNLSAYSGTEYHSATHQLLIDRDVMIIEPLDEKGKKTMIIPEDGVYVLDNGKKIKVEHLERTDKFSISKSKSCCCLSADDVKFPLTVRYVDTGDRFCPFGMKGSKLLSDYMTDRKMTLFDKRRQKVVADAAGRIVWVVNERPDNRFRITDETVEIIRLTLLSD